MTYIDKILTQLNKLTSTDGYSEIRYKFWRVYYEHYDIIVPLRLPESESFNITIESYNPYSGEIEKYSHDYEFSKFIETSINEWFHEFEDKLNRALYQLDNFKTKKAFIVAIYGQLKKIIENIEKEKSIKFEYKSIAIQTLKELLPKFAIKYKIEKSNNKLKGLNLYEEHSFNYKFKNRNTKNLIDLYKHLIKNGYIDSKTLQKSFLNVFTNSIIEDRILWTATNGEFYFLIKEISTHDSFEKVKSDLWKLASKCFIVLNNKTGVEYDPIKFHSWKEPTEEKKNKIKVFLRI